MKTSKMQEIDTSLWSKTVRKT